MGTSVGERVVVPSRGPGIVIGHVGTAAIVSLDAEPAENVIVQPELLRRAWGTGPRSVVISPSGRAKPLTRDMPRVRTRR